MPWDEQNTLERFDDSHLDRLNMAAALLNATGWIDHLARLVAIDTACPSGGGHASLTDALQDLFAPLGFALRQAEPQEGLRHSRPVAGPRMALVASRRTGRPICTIPCHMDTAPPGPGWTRPPLTLTRQGSLLFGRGTVNMKGAMIALWSALRAADAVGLPLRFDPVLLFTTDGGTGCFPGLRYLAEQHRLEGHVLYLNSTAAPRVWAGCLGTFDLEIRVSRCASAAGEHGAARALRTVLSALTDLQAELAQRSSRLPAEPERGGMLRPGLSFVSVGAETEPDGKEPLGVLVLKRRFTSEEGFSRALAELQERVERAARDAGFPCLIGCRVLRRQEAVADPGEGPNWPSWQRALGWGFGFSPTSFRRLGGLGGRVLGAVQQAGVREILLGGLLRPGQRPHAPDEHTTVEDVEALARSVLAYLADLPDVPDPC
ncbi:M20/M25/M40 family metallo-hydrolase [Roseomonas sp. M0104]|uniref:M20/M25/M40 family metallo-hydrolase n=1 Tax=Teichococcus coralli TaxID=2545983 RepID=A0A845B6A3_9PROT|nr:M20/M25/M40 family metallo-hydrolase [Pseudoroseomonas coralli]MXP61958.1 M20/M25/M40 family metallo-hydrolase [Pseudoroseomonas coralli]